MRHLTLYPHLTLEELKTRMMEQKQVRLLTYWQILNAVANGLGKRAQEIADVLGTTATIVKRIIRTYNVKGADFDKTITMGRSQAGYVIHEPGAGSKDDEATAIKGAQRHCIDLQR